MTADLRESLAHALGDAYTLGQELGGGGMSRVFLAQETALCRPVVVKALMPELASTVSAQRFAREVHAAATLQSPHIVPVLRAGNTVDEIPYYIMPFVRGETLRVRLARGRIPYAETVQLLGDVAKALAAAHEASMVHRDIKPDNILLTGGAASVTDFGIAHAIHEARAEATDPMLTSLGSSLGTPAYMAPEQACGDAIDARTDVYAWGVVAYEMIAGHHPFPTAHTAQRLIAAQIAARPAPLRTSGTPAWFCRLVMSCLAKEPGLRPDDGQALVHAVEYGEAGQAFGARCAATVRRMFGLSQSEA
jgi:serine/threonine-protein kinase